MQTYSIPSLSRQLQADPRRVTRALSGVPADAVTRGGQKRWLLATAADALGRHGHALTGSAAPRTNGDGSRRGNGFDVIDELEQVSAELRDALAKLRTVRSITQRRTQAKHIGPLLNRLHTALDRSAELMPSSDLRALSEPARREILGQFLAEIGSVLDFDFSRIA